MQIGHAQNYQELNDHNGGPGQLMSLKLDRFNQNLRRFSLTVI